MGKDELLKTLQRDWEKYWKLDVLLQNGFRRRRCVKCGKFFWSIEDQEICNDANCREYEFIGQPRTKQAYSYERAWEVIRNFFVRNGHIELDRFPVVCRWFPLYFTIAGIVDFYRMRDSELDFEFPAPSVTVLQPSLRFNDVANVGVTGRHWTCHSHVEQASLYDGKSGYWKERCIELDLKLLTKVFGIEMEEINFIEDVWLGAGAFGYSLEYHVAGLELGNAVFTEFKGTPQRYVTMDKKVIDMGAGLERFCWISQGTFTSYDAVFGKEVQRLLEIAGIEVDEALLERYARLSSRLNVEEMPSMETFWERLGKELNVSQRELRTKLGPIQAIYAILDHARALEFAIVDGGIPSNVGAGYNLRVILRRSLGLIEKYDLGFDFYEVLELVAKRFKRIHPELLSGLEKVKQIVRLEEERYKTSKERARRVVLARLSKGELSLEELLELYDSHGVTPETIDEIAHEIGREITIPQDFYARLAQRHERMEKEEEEIPEELAGYPPTEMLCYQDVREFEAIVLGNYGDFVILDRSAFYPEGGGQVNDTGSLKYGDAEVPVVRVIKMGNVILHEVRGNLPPKGAKVVGVVNWERRIKTTQHHTATHIVNYAARKILGDHVWQHGASKSPERAHLDLTHFASLTEEELKEIERLANEIVKKDLPVEISYMKRGEAERRFGFSIYQGGFPTTSELRIVSIGDLDHEACGGTHCKRTGEVGRIVLLDSTRIQDGIIRLEFVAGRACEELQSYYSSLTEALERELKTSREELVELVRRLIERREILEDRLRKTKEEIALLYARKLGFERVGKRRILVARVRGDPFILKQISLNLSGPDTIVVLLGVWKERNFLFVSAGAETGISARDLMQQICKKIGGRGGGNREVASGSLDVAIDETKLKQVVLEVIE